MRRDLWRVTAQRVLVAIAVVCTGAFVIVWAIVLFPLVGDRIGLPIEGNTGLRQLGRLFYGFIHNIFRVYPVPDVYDGEMQVYYGAFVLTVISFVCIALIVVSGKSLSKLPSKDGPS